MVIGCEASALCGLPLLPDRLAKQRCRVSLVAEHGYLRGHVNLNLRADGGCPLRVQSNHACHFDPFAHQSSGLAPAA